MLNATVEFFVSDETPRAGVAKLQYLVMGGSLPQRPHNLNSAEGGVCLTTIPRSRNLTIDVRKPKSPSNKPKQSQMTKTIL